MGGIELPDSAKGVDLTGKTVIVTGANNGIGKETARELARAGAKVILACRNQALAELAREDIVKTTRNVDVVVKVLDLASLKSVRHFAADINNTESRLDILVNNAGLYSRTRNLTKDGFELTFGTNHLGPFLLTNLLLNKLKSNAPSRIVNVSSDAHLGCAVDLDDLQVEKKYDAFTVYGRSKSANIMHAVQLAKVLQDSGVSVYSLHPGEIHTGLMREYSFVNNFIGRWIATRVMQYYTSRPMLSVEQGALTTLYCCLEPSIADVSGKYYSSCHEKRAKSHATKDDRVQKLWDVSTELVNRTISKL